MRIFVMEGCDEYEVWQTDADDALIKRYCKVNQEKLVAICEGQLMQEGPFSFREMSARADH